MRKILFGISLILLSSCKENPKKIQTDNEFLKTSLSTEIERMMEETGIPSISIVLIENDSLTWAKSFGHSNVKLQTPATTSTVYSTGSTAKPFLAVAILQLAEKGILDLDEPVNNYLPEPLPSFSDTAKPITLRHLLSHQSGISASTDFIPLWGKGHRKTLKEVVSEIKLVREPEELFEYSNNGFVVATLAMEEQTGMKYGNYVETYILKPLGLSNISFTQPNPRMVEEMALPYKLIYNKALPVEQLYSQPFPAGGLTYLSPSQMSKFLITILNNGNYNGKMILNKQSIHELKKVSFGHEYYGLGIGVEMKEDNKYWFHSGLQDGFTASFKLNIDSKKGVYLMANTIAERHLSELTELAMELLDGKKDYSKIPSFATKEYKEIELNANDMNKFIGSYKIEGTQVNLSIKKSNDKLFLINPANLKYEIAPYDKDKFYLKTVEEQIEFINSENGIEEMIFYKREQEQFRANKMK